MISVYLKEWKIIDINEKGNISKVTDYFSLYFEQ